jgi:N-acetylmuramoyl-L-alanine amidase
MGLLHRVARRGRRGVLAGLVAAGLALVLAPATSTSADIRPAPAQAPDQAPGPAQAQARAAAASRAPAATGAAARAATRRPLAGKVVGIDPGHNGLNYTSPAFLDRKIWNGREWEGCDTTGTQTAGGYTEARFNWNVAVYLRADLIRMGARVVMTRTGLSGLGPCVDTRSRILNRAHANVSIDIHADYGPRSGRGFTVLEPVADGPNNKVIGSSKRLGRDVHAMMLRDTALRISDYYGRDGYISRNDLAGLNLTTMPKVLIETGNMRNAADAALLVTPKVQRAVAAALAAAIARFLSGH